MKKLYFVFALLAQTFFAAAQVTDDLGNIHFLKENDKVETILNKNQNI
jgi:hypothetical protein